MEIKWLHSKFQGNFLFYNQKKKKKKPTWEVLCTFYLNNLSTISWDIQKLCFNKKKKKIIMSSITL